MFTRFAKTARTVVTQALKEAEWLGAPTVEAEHLLLALAGRPALDSAGLNRDAILDLLEVEFEETLAVVGVSIGALGLPTPVAVADKPRFGTSAKVALERSLEEALARHDNHIGPDHILLALLRAEFGTVPRALDRAGVDRRELAASVA